MESGSELLSLSDLQHRVTSPNVTNKVRVTGVKRGAKYWHYGCDGVDDRG